MPQILLAFLLVVLVNSGFCKEYIFKVNTIKPKKEIVNIYYETNGISKADLAVNLKPEISGRVLKVFVNEGQKVKKGEKLAVIDPRKINNQYKAQIFTIKKLESIYNYNLSLFKRKEFLYKKGLISEEEYEIAKKNLKVSENDLLSAKENLKEIARQKQEAVLKAPFDGIIDKKYINVGDLVNQNTKMFYIIDPKSIYIEFFLPQRFFNRIKTSQDINLYIEGIGATKGKIEYISFSFTEENLIRLKASIKTISLPEGVYAKVKILDKTIEGYRLPEKAVYLKAEESYVLVAKNGIAKKVPVKIYGQEKGYLIVKANFESSDQIILDAPFGIQENSKVEVVNK